MSKRTQNKIIFTTPTGLVIDWENPGETLYTADDMAAMMATTRCLPDDPNSPTIADVGYLILQELDARVRPEMPENPAYAMGAMITAFVALAFAAYLPHASNVFRLNPERYQYKLLRVAMQIQLHLRHAKSKERPIGSNFVVDSAEEYAERELEKATEALKHIDTAQTIKREKEALTRLIIEIMTPYLNTARAIDEKIKVRSCLLD